VRQGASCGIATAATIDRAVLMFLDGSDVDEATVTFLLVTGPEGSGKTHICDTAERLAGGYALGK